MLKVFKMVKFVLILTLLWFHWTHALDIQTSLQIREGYLDASTMSKIQNPNQIKATDLGSCAVFCHSKILKLQKCNVYYLDDGFCKIGYLEDPKWISKQGPILVKYMDGFQLSTTITTPP